MGLFSKKRQKDEADLIYEQARKRAYAREVRHIAASKGWKAGKALAQNRFNQPMPANSSGIDGFKKSVLEHKDQLQYFANVDLVGASNYLNTKKERK